MDDLTKKHLQDILTAIEEIESFFGSEPKLYDDFYSNLCLRRAVERNIEIIGEAMNRISKTLMFKNKKRNMIDSIAVDLAIHDNKIEVFPFLVASYTKSLEK